MSIIFDYVLVPHFVQNFAPALSSAPQDLQPPDVDDRCGISAGSGDGSVPGAENPCDADTIDGGLPGVCAGIVGTLPGIPIPPPNPPIPGISPGDCVPPRFPDPARSSAFFISKITFTAKNSNAEYATT